MAVDRKRERGASISKRGMNSLLSNARERTQQELAKRSIDLATDPKSRSTMIAALAAVAAVPVADAVSLLDMLDSVADAPISNAETNVQNVVACRRSCG
jgi:hypothetical protein